MTDVKRTNTKKESREPKNYQYTFSKRLQDPKFHVDPGIDCQRILLFLQRLGCALLAVLINSLKPFLSASISG